MRLTIKEKAGVVDTSRVFEDLHLNESFIRNMADGKKRAILEGELIEVGERHFRTCDKCRNKFGEFKREPKKQDLPL